MANRGKMRQIEDVKSSKIVVEIGVFYYRCPFVTLGDLECRGLISLFFHILPVIIKSISAPQAVIIFCAKLIAYR